jgi:hypothetical protein
MRNEIYVVVCDNDSDPRGRIVVEEYVADATIENAQKRCRNFEKKFGKCRIAKLQFIDDGEKA